MYLVRPEWKFGTAICRLKPRFSIDRGAEGETHFRDTFKTGGQFMRVARLVVSVLALAFVALSYVEVALAGDCVPGTTVNGKCTKPPPPPGK